MSVVQVDSSTIRISSKIPTVIAGLLLSLKKSGVDIDGTKEVLLEWVTPLSYIDLSTELCSQIINLEGGQEYTVLLRYSNLSDFFDSLNLEKENIYFKEFLFRDFIREYDLETLNWIVNVLEKTVSKGGGVTPNYLNSRTLDGVNFWIAVIKFFSLYVRTAEVFGNLSSLEGVLREYLTQRDIYLEPETSLTDLNLIKDDVYKEFSKRGTLQVFEEDNLKGELLRLLNTDRIEFGLIETNKRGWNLRDFSPLNRSLIGLEQICKFGDYNNILVNSTGDVELNNNVFTIHSGGEISGNHLKVYDRQSYTLSFNLVMTPGASLTVDILGGLRWRWSNAVKNSEILTLTNVESVEKKLFIQIHVYNHDIPPFPEDLLNIGVKGNLILQEGETSVEPVFEVTSGEVEIHNLTFIPSFTIPSRGFNYSKYLLIWGDNRSEMTVGELEYVIKEKFLPYDMSVLFTDIGVGGPTYTDPGQPVEPVERPTHWLGETPTCLYEEVEQGIFTEEYQNEFQ